MIRAFVCLAAALARPRRGLRRGMERGRVDVRDGMFSLCLISEERGVRCEATRQKKAERKTAGSSVGELRCLAGLTRSLGKIEIDRVCACHLFVLQAMAAPPRHLTSLAVAFIHSFPTLLIARSQYYHHRHKDERQPRHERQRVRSCVEAPLRPQFASSHHAPAPLRPPSHRGRTGMRLQQQQHASAGFFDPDSGSQTLHKGLTHHPQAASSCR